LSSIRDLGAKVELVDHFAGTRREARDVRSKVPSDLAGVIKQATKVQRRRVEEPFPGYLLEHRFDVLDLPLQLLGAVDDCCLGRLEDAVEATDDCQGQDDLAVLGLLVVAWEQVSHLPDEGSVVADSGVAHVFIPSPRTGVRVALAKSPGPDASVAADDEGGSRGLAGSTAARG
jgi:hypothetical protein